MSKTQRKIISLLLALLIASISFGILANHIPNSAVIADTVQSLDDSRDMIMRFAGIAIGISTVITLIPDDIGTPVADVAADMSKYFVILLAVIAFERLIVSAGIKYFFMYLIPVACGIYGIGVVSGKKAISSFGIRLTAAVVAMMTVIPLSTRLMDTIGSEYKEYVISTIDEVENDSAKINETMSSSKSESTTIFERLSDTLKAGIKGIGDIIDYIRELIKKCMSTIAILMVQHIGIPVATLLFLKWLLSELFRFDSYHVSNGDKS